MIHLGDITKISGHDAPPVDVVIGGSPCQDLSIAGERAGLAGERSGLFIEQIRVIKEFRENEKRAGRTGQLIRPRYMVWENVPGALSSNKGEDFRAVLEETARVAQPDATIPRYEGGWRTSGCILGDGWSIAWRVLDAQFWGVPQRRRRIALVADFGGHAAPEILFVRKSVCGDIAPGGAPGEETAGGAGAGAYQTVARSLTARYDGSPCIDRGPNVVVAGFKYHQGSGAGNIGFQEETSPTLGTDHNPAVISFNTVFDARGNGNGETVPTITGDHENRVTDYTAIVAAVDCRNGVENAEVNGTLQAKSTGGSSLNLNNVVREAGTVRRLTPLECERLQGFPDGWTDIGEWTDTKGKRHDTSDAARYKALGNSIATPPWSWVLKRICACYERPATMASLFDGIGGFPLIWERLNGPGTCLWASEIEEFPIAVTKLHFGGDAV